MCAHKLFVGAQIEGDMRTRFSVPRVVGEDEPLRLEIAAGQAFPDGSMTAAGLRREHKRGRLVIERVAGKDYTTLRAIREMREKCRNEVRACVFGSSRRADESRPRGLFEMGQSNNALVVARAKLRKLSER